ncbi:hypothetical protein GALMADRAFT_225666 [Galerina marginata CBS 339.88]|uniref:Uncharacterized protein n=1 Tax=Galerina marginata (strain CBS 339.88) TaxID=685588 RepID=A0A067T9Z7_GALM3|nr:hypothetical protein GALMADRAFT_225666 [Galerina marginata CBS 339.88]
MDIDPMPAEPDAPPPKAPTPPLFVPPPTRSGRTRKFPQKFTDFLPNSTTRLPHLPEREPPAPKPAPKRQEYSPEPIAASPEPEPVVLRTQPNEFGLYRVYVSYPTKEIDDNDNLDDLCDSPGLATAQSSNQSRWWKAMGVTPSHESRGLFAPFMNATVFRILNWFYSGSNLKSVGELNRLVNDDFSAKRELQRLDNDDKKSSPFAEENGWKTSTVKIPLPAERVKHRSEADAPILEVPNVHHRSLVEVITTAFKDETAAQLHLTPFRLFWKPTPDSTPERVITELYNADAFIEEHKKILKQTPEPGPQLETGVIGMMLWSDSTHLANFGDASLWPAYLFFGNHSQYFRGSPNNFAAHHIAYFPSLPSDLQDIYMKAFDGIAASAATITHLKRELMHAVWLLLLDPEFMYAYVHGIVMECADGIIRRLFPRFFTYSADYPEKILLATIRYLARCPCPRCGIQKRRIGGLGTHVDNQRRQHIRVDTQQRQEKVEISRKWIFVHGKGVKSKPVEDLLQEDSYIPTRNAFSTRLFEFGFNFFSMFVPDLLHEFELGVWKAIFTHLMRILYAIGENCIQKLNWRYRRVQTFGRDTIRRFSNNASAMKKLAARDFEDLLQCSMPVFEGLFPGRDDQFVQDMLFTLCTWHAYAKLRLHTTSTLIGLKASTRSLGQLLRDFLPREEAARVRRRANAAKKGNSKKANPDGKNPKKSRVRKLFNLLTYKLHALGDYVAAILQFGPSNSYSTQTGELEHRRVKRFYARTNKGRTFQRQISKHHRRERILRRIASRVKLSQTQAESSIPSHPTQHQPSVNITTPAPAPPIHLDTPIVPFDQSDALPATLPEQHHHISNSKRHSLNVFRWLDDNEGDPALTNFLPNLKDHLLSRLLGHETDEIFYSDDERDNLQISNDLIFRHKVIRINYTTYDLRRSQDSINPRTHADIMTLSGEDDNAENHPYSYARVLGIFHVDVKQRGPQSKSSQTRRMDFLWVRWFEIDRGYAAGWKARRLHRIRFVNSDSPTAFGFLDPSDVIRGSHLLPAFAHGTTGRLLGPSIARRADEKDLEDRDWKYLYVNMFVDRDMFVRFLGGGVGHKATNTYTSGLRPEFDSASSFEMDCGEDDGPDMADVDEEEKDEDEVDSEDEDWGYKSGESDSEEEEGEDSWEDDESGAEDGEEPWGMTDGEAVGYAEF